tara:strand:- start:587 stop:1228 length:642 start_codon:yes stop_codon:yes gene_type:complete
MELDFTEQIKSNSSLWENIRKKKERIKRGSPERMRKPGEKGAPTKEQIERAKGEKSKALTKDQKKKFMRLEKEVSMKDFIKRYGEKEGKAIYYATITKMAKAADKRIPEKKKDGTKRPKSEHSDLYTDEDPKDTIKGLGFKDKKTALESIKKIERSGRPHAHKVQATMAMEQRSRFAAKNAKDPDTKKRLKSANLIYKIYLEKLKKRTKNNKK